MSQSPDLGTAASFVIFTASGAVANTAKSQITGNIGTHAGAITGFEPPTIVIGTIQSENSITEQVAIDVQSAYDQLFNTPATSTTHTPVFGSGETLFEGVYSISAAGSITGNLILDAQGDPDAIFIFKFGGAFTTAASASVTLINGAQALNVYWIAEGAIAMAALTSMKGTLIANNGAISMGARGQLEGRMWSTIGAASVYSVTISLLPFPTLESGEIPDLGAAAEFVIFTGGGAVGNTGISNIGGSIGTQVGAITGFEPPSVVLGNIESANPKTMQASLDLQAAFNQIFNTTPTVTDHTPAFGGGETIFPGVYSIAAAGSVNGILNLDAQMDANAVFIFKFGGAFTTGAITTINLLNGASACNVFWAADGAIALAATTSMKGTVIANNGAVSMGDGGTLEGRLLSTEGAAAVYNLTAVLPVCFSAPFSINLVSFEGLCEKQKIVLKWSTLTESDNDFFTIEKSTEGVHWYPVGNVDGNGSSTSLHNYTFTDKLPSQHFSFYRLGQTDFEGIFKYGNPITIENCGADQKGAFTIYPNPSSGKFKLDFLARPIQDYTVEIINLQGIKMEVQKGSSNLFDLTNKPPGIYFIVVKQQGMVWNGRLILTDQ